MLKLCCRRARSLIDGPRDPGTGKTADELLRTEPWFLTFALRQLGSSLSSATCALISTRAAMIDEDHPAYSVVELVEDALIEVDEELAKLEESDAEAQP